MRAVYAAGMVLSTITAVLGSVMVAMVFVVGPLPQEPADARARRFAVFATATALLIASAIFCGTRLRRVNTPGGVVAEPRRRRVMNWFDKCCAALAVALGVALILLGAMGLFVGCHAGFNLPPVLGVLPALAGWGIFRSVLIAWRVPRDLTPPATPPAIS